VIERVAVVVPAADEIERIGSCLHSIRRACATLPGLLGRRVVTDVVVALDACTDGTAQFVASCTGVASVAVTARRVGVTRQAGSEYALARAAVAGIAPERVWLASTDADSRVPADWLVHQLSRADDGADLVLGTVCPDRELDDSARTLWFARHQLNEGHPHVHGANLGIRGSALRAVRGWPPAASGEDVELVARVRAGGGRIDRISTGRVITSARREGRAPAGFSSYLRELTSAPVRVRSGPATRAR
jgi:cellulose synthase/poly-beta-1,6-N-acetylglucosamine synthase-like glycosyltransferase